LTVPGGDASTDGKITYHITFNDMTGTLSITRTSGITSIDLNLLVLPVKSTIITLLPTLTYFDYEKILLLIIAFLVYIQ